MDIHKQAIDIVRQIEDAPEEIQANEYELDRARGYVQSALDNHKSEGNFKVGDCQCLLITNPCPVVYSMQIWVVTLIDNATLKVRTDLFFESRD